MALVGSRPRRNLLDTSQSRDSNALRASVLEAALELGISTSRPLADLIFNTVDEEDELEILTTPALTSASATTSDENSPSVPPWNAAHPLFVPPSLQPVPVAPPTFDTQSSRAPSEESHPPPSFRPNQPRKLRKARKDDGYDSEGYLSDSSKKKKKNKDRKNAGPPSHEAEFLSDGGYLSDTTKKKKKDKKGDKLTDGYVTDSSTKAQKKSAKKSSSRLEDGDLSEGGYLSEVSLKKKKTFFRLGSRSPSTSRKGGSSSDPLPPPVPALPPQAQAHPIADRFARSPVPSEEPDGGSVTPSIRTAYSPIPPSVNESLTPLTSAFVGRAWSPTSDSVRTANRPPSADLSLENFTSSSMSHETNQFSPDSPSMQSWEAVPYAHSQARSREAEGRALSPGSSSHEHLTPAAPRPHGVRFTPSTRFSPSESTFPVPPSPSEVPVAPDNRQMRPKISLPITSGLNSNTSSASPSPLHSILRNSPSMSSPSDSRPFLSPAPRPRTAPSPKPAFLRGASPSQSDLSIISSSEFIVPSPRPRFYDELPPPSPPPTGPLPDVPPSGGLYAQPIPSIKRGREAPFPARGVLPAEEASRLIETTLRARREALLARLADSGTGNRDSEFVGVDNDNIVPDMPWLAAETGPMPPPSPPPEEQREVEEDWPDDESVRPDIAEFYLYEPDGNRVSASIGGRADIVAGRRRSPDAPHDERSTYTYSYTPSTSGDARGDVESYYFGAPSDDEGVDDNGTEAQSRASFVDDERSHNMRERLIARVDALYGAEKVPPVPKLRPF